ncbi:hypothetical protein [Candidatus Igneacidithiobacillus taiwanensis]|uniref:hypothetical protein n=1 Tax=Candidatus Igneacidithiobacillus taiwanensis TaxID=1945924 RepID=UPI0028A23142|nr:hypothetical protein [Candidatus Igneacidithiobacillus taiwanensis]
MRGLAAALPPFPELTRLNSWISLVSRKAAMATKHLPEAHSQTFPEDTPTGNAKTEAPPFRPLGLGAGRFSMPENVDRIGAEDIEELFLGPQH